MTIGISARLPAYPLDAAPWRGRSPASIARRRQGCVVTCPSCHPDRGGRLKTPAPMAGARVSLRLPLTVGPADAEEDFR